MSENGLWIRLGSGKTEQFGVRGIAALLDKAARAGLNVPSGIVILDTVWDQAILRGLLLVGHGKMDIPSPQRLTGFLSLPQFERPVTIQPAFSNRRDGSEDHITLPGKVSLDIIQLQNVDDAPRLAGALSEIWSSAIRYLALETGAMPRVEGTGDIRPVRPPSEPRQRTEPRRSTDEISLGQYVRRDVLLLETVEAKVRGIAYTQQAYEDDLICFDSSHRGRAITEEDDSCDRVLLPKLRGWERHRQSALKQVAQVEWSPRLQELLREVRRWVGQQKNIDWKIEWADDGSICWLLWMEPIVKSPPRRHELFVPALPADFAQVEPHIVGACEVNITAYFRRFDPGFARSRRLYGAEGQRQALNVGLVAEFLRALGLSTRRLWMTYDLTPDTVEAVSATFKHPVNRRRIVVKTLRLRLPAFWLSQLRLAWKIHRRATEICTLEASEVLKADDLSQTIEQLYIWHITQVITFERIFNPIAALMHRLGKSEFQSPRQALKKAVQIVTARLVQLSDDVPVDNDA